MIFPIPNMLQDTLHFQAVDFIKPKNQHPKDHTICALHQQSRWQRVVETRMGKNPNWQSGMCHILYSWVCNWE
jgi:hypothetical protein